MTPATSAVPRSGVVPAALDRAGRRAAGVLSARTAVPERFRVTGGRVPCGSVRVPGAKNSALKLMAAALLAPGASTLSDVPDILDVHLMAELLRRMGCEVRFDPQAGTATVDVPDEPRHEADYQMVRAMRASISVLGPLVARCHAARVALPGGDEIGSRGLDLHMAGLERMGARVEVRHGFLVAEAPRGLTGTRYRLPLPSVGATENLIMAATLAAGVSVIDNAAREPEIVDLCRMLVRMGARIGGIGTSTIHVEGVCGLRPVAHRVVPDRIVAGTWAFCAAACAGDIVVRNGEAGHLQVVLGKLVDAGAQVHGLDDGFRVVGPERPRSVEVATLPYPGFPTDLQPFAVVLDAVADGSAMITENLFESRFRFVREIARLGADVRIDGHHAMVRGRPRLSGAPVEASDIRAGAALVVAGMLADGDTTVSGAQHIDRGYEAFEVSLAGLGVPVVREPDSGFS